MAAHWAKLTQYLDTLAEFMTSIVGISIVNYKTPHLVKECLESLSQDNRSAANTRVVVVDNASGDNSYLELSHFVADQRWQGWVEVIAAEKNGGFSYGNNIAFRRLIEQGCDYLWMVNPDTKLLPGACEALLATFRADPGVGAAGSRLEDTDGTPQISAFNFPSPLGEFVNTSRLGFVYRRFPKAVVARPVLQEPQPVDWVAGASMMLSRSVLDKVGFMDDKYFLYFEEVDFCYAINQAGFKIMYVPTSRVIHYVGAATGISDTRKQAPRRPAYWFESRQRFFQKTYGFAPTLLADSLWILAYSSYRLRNLIQRKPMLDPPHFLVDFIRHSALVRGKVVQ